MVKEVLNIYPSLMAGKQEEFNSMLVRLRGVAKNVHLDVADGHFVATRVNWFNLALPREFSYSAHLMVNKPLPWIEKYGLRMSTIIIHPEPLRDVTLVLGELKALKKRAGLALKPETSVASVKKYLSLVDVIVVLTVHPGYYGAKFLSAPLKKIKQIKKINPRIEVIVDGGMNPLTIRFAVKAGADGVVSGSFITKSADPKKARLELMRAARS